ncbi:MAG: hypothetical protein CFE23_08990 [Flavobacterium sp. BFFFF1]|uniref:hypothetical protein n=1 Tax=Flavobacterium sp. BFFFF1 TaxID=2015557 RepID=UPI000BC62159|nr:hypothetical protein [Flavobacterium sp. BFFFF1]OYU80603.1 MAG: hypothetical protein CFE23_08990 [Flavobacterium sp. BFFFF1]
MSAPKSYFFRSFLIVLLSAVFFLGVKRVLPKRIFSEKAGATKNVLIDSMLIDAFEAEKDSAQAGIGDTLGNQPITYYATNGIKFPEEQYEDYKGNQYLISFYEKLYQLETAQNGNVRIAYFGDSMTDGDMIVQDLRNNFQHKYGGKGVGFVAITSESAASRSSVIHEFSSNWKMQSYLNVKNPARPFGINGHVFFANDTNHIAWVKYKSGKYTTQLDNPTLFYGSSENKKGEISYVVGKDTLRKKLVTDNLLNTLNLSQNGLKSVKVDFKSARSIPVYGFNFDDGKGVHIDNFSQRGNSGIPISNFDVSLMKAFQKKLNYDLIVLHYGTNVLNYGTKNYNWYEKSMTRTVNRLRECFPGVSILIISTADKATKYDTEMKTDSAVVPLSNAQKHYALKTASGFVNLYTLMGGDGSMVKWVEEEPAMANKDYTHFNFRGAKKVAAMLYSQLNAGYEQFKQLRKSTEGKAESDEHPIDSIAPDNANPDDEE